MSKSLRLIALIGLGVVVLGLAGWRLYGLRRSLGSAQSVQLTSINPTQFQVTCLADLTKLQFGAMELGVSDAAGEAVFSWVRTRCDLLTATGKPTGQIITLSLFDETDTLYHVMGDYSTANKTKGAAYDDGFRATIIKRLWGEGKQVLTFNLGQTYSGDLQRLYQNWLEQHQVELTRFRQSGLAQDLPQLMIGLK